MQVTVIVCTYNRCQLLAGSLEALKRQRVGPDVEWELLVVDNNCTDETAAVVDRVAVDFPTAIRRVQESRQGLSNARNRGIAEARGSYLLFTDDDTRPCEDWIARIMDGFRSGTHDAIGGRVDILWPIPRPSWFADELVSSLAGVDYGDEPIELTEAQPPLGANMGFSKRVFEEVGGFDPELGRIGKKLIGGEETDLFRRLLAAGMRGIYQPLAVVKHFVERDRVRKHYFRKLYYYGGVSSARGKGGRGGRTIAGVPAFAVRQVGEKVLACLYERVAGNADRSFMRQLQACWLVGFMQGCRAYAPVAGAPDPS